MNTENMNAQQLCLASIDHWQRALTGVLSIPTAIALGASSAALFAVSIVHEGMNLVRTSVDAAARTTETPRDGQRRERSSAQASPIA